MDSKSILTFQKNRILKIIDNFIEEYLLLLKKIMKEYFLIAFYAIYLMVDFHLYLIQAKDMNTFILMIFFL